MMMESFQNNVMPKDSLLIGNLRKIVCSLLLLSVLWSCAEKVIEPPQNLIAKDKMIEILYDLALLNAANATNPKALKDNSVEIMPYLFEKHQIDSIQFTESDLYYASMPLEYENIYETILQRIEIEVEEVEKARKIKTENARKNADKVRDSLKKLNQSAKPPVLSRTESNDEQ